MHRSVIGIGRRQNQERTFGDEVHGEVVEMIDVLILQPEGASPMTARSASSVRIMDMVSSFS